MSKKAIAVYEIDTDKIDVASGQSIFDKLKFELSNCVNNKSEISVQTSLFSGYDPHFILFHNLTKSSWVSFVEEFLQTETKAEEYKNYSAILLLKKTGDEDKIYAISFGNIAPHVLKPYINESFGLDILSRIIDVKDDVCKVSKGQNVTGSTQGEINVYRQLYAINEIEDFGKIFQELNVVLQKNVFEKFGISNERKFRNCIAKSSFQIRTAITPGAIKNFLDGIAWAKQQTPNPINSTKKLDKNRDRILIEQLNSQLANNLFNRYNRTNDAYQYDISHRDFEKYLCAERYSITFEHCHKDVNDSIVDIETLFNNIPRAPTPMTKEYLTRFVEKGKITTFDDTDSIVTVDTIKKHLFAEESILDNRYFLLNGDWYQLLGQFISSLNEKIINLSSNYQHKIDFLKNWPIGKSETEYINEHNTLDNKIIVHPSVYKNIELCDIVYWNQDTLYLYFIKKNFGNSQRDLSYQIYLSAKLINQSLEDSNRSTLRGFYQGIATSTNVPESDFLRLFDKKIVYVCAVYDERNREPFLLNPEEYHSNIAKFSILDLVDKMNKIRKGNLEIMQIKQMDIR